MACEGPWRQGALGARVAHPDARAIAQPMTATGTSASPARAAPGAPRSAGPARTATAAPSSANTTAHTSAATITSASASYPPSRKPRKPTTPSARSRSRRATARRPPRTRDEEPHPLGDEQQDDSQRPDRVEEEQQADDLDLGVAPMEEPAVLKARDEHAHRREHDQPKGERIGSGGLEQTSHPARCTRPTHAARRTSPLARRPSPPPEARAVAGGAIQLSDRSSSLATWRVVPRCLAALDAGGCILQPPPVQQLDSDGTTLAVVGVLSGEFFAAGASGWSEHRTPAGCEVLGRGTPTARGRASSRRRRARGARSATTSSSWSSPTRPAGSCSPTCPASAWRPRGLRTTSAWRPSWQRSAGSKITGRLPIAGVAVEVRDSDETLVATLTTDARGKVTPPDTSDNELQSQQHPRSYAYDSGR